MRGLPLRFVHCEHWRDKLIAHSPPGCYTILFAMVIYLNLGGPHRRRGVNKPIFIIGMFLYLSCSTHFALEFVHFYKVLVSAMPYPSHAISEHLQYRIPQASRDSQTRRTLSLAPGPVSSSQSRISSVNLSLSTAFGCCGPRVIGSSFFRALLRLRA
jgi:hypothetical protein